VRRNLEKIVRYGVISAMLSGCFIAPETYCGTAPQKKSVILLNHIVPENHLLISGAKSASQEKDLGDEVILEAFDSSGKKVGLAQYTLPDKGKTLDLAIKDIPFESIEEKDVSFFKTIIRKMASAVSTPQYGSQTARPDVSKISLIKVSSNYKNFFSSIRTPKSPQKDGTAIPGLNIAALNASKIIKDYFNNQKSGQNTNAAQASRSSSATKKASDLLSRISEYTVPPEQNLPNQPEMIRIDLSQTVDVPITFSGPSVAALQMSINPPPGFVYLGITPGTSATSAGKSVDAEYYSLVNPTERINRVNSNKMAIRVLITGLGGSLQSTIPNGVVATLKFGIQRTMGRGISQLTIDSIAASSSNAYDIDPSAVNVTAQVIPLTPSYPILPRPIIMGSSVTNGQISLRPATTTRRASSRSQIGISQEPGSFIPSQSKWNPIPSQELYFPSIYTTIPGEIGLINPNDTPINVLLTGYDKTIETPSQCYITIGAKGRYFFTSNDLKADWLGVYSNLPLFGYQGGNLGPKNISNATPGSREIGTILFDQKPEPESSYSILNPSKNGVNIRISGMNENGNQIAQVRKYLSPKETSTEMISDLLNVSSAMLQQLSLVEFSVEGETEGIVGTTFRPTTGLEPLINMTPERSFDNYIRPEGAFPVPSCPVPVDNMTEPLSSTELFNQPRQKLEIMTENNQRLMDMRNSSSTKYALSTDAAPKTVLAAFKDNVNVAWDYANGTTVVGFKIYRGATSILANGSFDINYTFAGSETRTGNVPITPDMNFMVATAYDNSTESGYSNEISIHGFGLMDIDGNAKANVTDLQLEALVLLGQRSCPSNCNVNKSGGSSPDFSDIQTMVNYLLGRIAPP
jgi:hypothetical protein